MKKIWFLSFAIIVLSFSCSKEDEDDTPQQPETINYTQVEIDEKQPFIALLSRHDCGACGAYGHPLFDQKAKNKRINAVSFYYKEEDPNFTPVSRELAEYHQIFGTPTFLRGMDYLKNDTTKWKNSIDSTLNTAAEVNIKIDAYSIGNTLTYKGIINSKQPFSNDVRFSVYVVENNVFGRQYTYNGNKWIDEYEHNHVLRSAPHGLWGQSIDLSNSSTETEELTITIAPFNKNNLNLVGVVYLMDNGEPVSVLNSRTLELKK
jgi:hypothetical protein